MACAPAPPSRMPAMFLSFPATPLPAIHRHPPPVLSFLPGICCGFLAEGVNCAHAQVPALTMTPEFPELGQFWLHPPGWAVPAPGLSPGPGFPAVAVCLLSVRLWGGSPTTMQSISGGSLQLPEATYASYLFSLQRLFRARAKGPGLDLPQFPQLYS